MDEEKIRYLQKKANEIRESTLDMCIKGGTGHVTSSFSCAEILTSLYYGNVLRYNPKEPEWEARDRFILSKGQASPILYSVLADLDFFPKNWMNRFCKSNAKFGVHLQCDVPGVEYTTGSLGHGLGFAAGTALAAKMNRRSYHTVTLLGDAELYEGSNWESAIFAGHYRLNNLVAVVDRNWLGVIGFTEDLLKLNPIDKKFESFGWDTKNINGHSVEEILDAFKDIRSHKRDKPYAIIADTVKGKGIKFMEAAPLWHGVAPLGAEGERARKELKQYILENEQ